MIFTFIFNAQRATEKSRSLTQKRIYILEILTKTGTAGCPTQYQNKTTNKGKQTIPSSHSQCAIYKFKETHYNSPSGAKKATWLTVQILYVYPKQIS